MLSLRLTVALFIILITPLFLRSKFGERFEPFPAILLPTGATIAQVKAKEINREDWVIYAKKEGKAWEKIDIQKLLYPIPTQYYSSIISRGFGLNQSVKSQNSKYSSFNTIKNFLKPQIIDKIKLTDVKIWLKKRLEKQHLNNCSEIKITQIITTISLPDYKTINNIITHEEILHLY